MKTIKRAVVTGGAGFIGSHLVESLVNADVQVTVIDNLSTGHRKNLETVKHRITFIKGDIRDQKTMREASTNCDVIFHQAAVVSVPQTVEDPVGSASVNIAGTLNVLEAGRLTGVDRVVLASSCAVYGDDPVQPKNEQLSTHPKSPYALQKWIGEHHAKLYYELYGLQSISLRYFNVFGPKQDPSSPYSGVISIFMNRAVAHQKPTIYGNGEQSRDFIFVLDVVSANLKAAMADDAGGIVLNVGTGNSITINQLWQKTAHLSGFNLKPHYESPRKGDIDQSLADIRKAEKVIAFRPKYSFDKGLKTTMAWYKKYTWGGK